MKKINYLGFSKFRELMETWDQYVIYENRENELNDLLNKHDFTLFFKKNKQIYGCPEESRVVFANLKAGDKLDAMVLGKKKDIKFSAFNLSKAINGKDDDRIENLFGEEDLDEIKIISREKAIKLLLK
jgi:hypothetical protein